MRNIKIEVMPLFFLEMNILEYSIVLNNIGVFIFFTVLIIILALFIPRECNYASENGECNRRPCNRLLKRDFKYCTAMLILCIVFVATFVMGKEDSILSYISFASTVTSIILSVLAIMMTLFAESKSDTVKGKLENFLDEIDKVSDNTKNQADNLNNIYDQMKERFSTYENILKEQKKLKVILIL